MSNSPSVTKAEFETTLALGPEQLFGILKDMGEGRENLSINWGTRCQKQIVLKKWGDGVDVVWSIHFDYNGEGYHTRGARVFDLQNDEDSNYIKVDDLYDELAKLLD